jgi:hypothetical protein
MVEMSSRGMILQADKGKEIKSRQSLIDPLKTPSELEV